MDDDPPQTSADVARYWDRNARDWTRLSRAGHDVYRDVLNTSAFMAILPDITGLDGLDIGCGEGTNTRQVAARAAHMTAIDIAPVFIEEARSTERAQPLGINFVVGDATALPFADARFDFATAFMSLMDMPDQTAAFGEAYRVIRAGGFFQFSILHPCFAPPVRKVFRSPAGEVLAIQVADYFDDEPGVVERWCFSTAPEQDRAKPFAVPRYHYPLSTWVRFICEAGFVIEQFAEPAASEETARAHPKVSDTRVAPLFLHIRVRKPA